ncbi:hypothetical protein LV779_34465 [Streptomyces thinghirensis]|nr:hypothetical protein [Streptomyces thinghirensis]
MDLVPLDTESGLRAHAPAWPRAATGLCGRSAPRRRRAARCGPAALDRPAPHGHRRAEPRADAGTPAGSRAEGEVRRLTTEPARPHPAPPAARTWRQASSSAPTGWTRRCPLSATAWGLRRQR